MKKYPFSNKAIKALLAATIALSPVVTTGITFDSMKVEAATTDYTSVDTLTSYLDRMYDQLSASEKSDLDATRDKINALNWKEYSADIIKDTPTPPTAAEITLVEELLKIFTSTNVLDIKNKIEEFKTGQAGNVDSVFGPEVTVDKILKFIADVELSYLEKLKGKNLSNITETEIYVDFLDTILSVKNQTPDNRLIGDKFISVIDPVGTLTALQKITRETDPQGKTRTILINTLKKVQPATGGGGSVTPTPTPVPNPTPNPEPGAPNVIIIPKDSVEVVKGNNSSGKVEVVTKISNQKVTDIVNLITSEKSVIELKLEKAGVGEIVKAQIPSSLFTGAANKNKKASVVISTEEASYKLPVSEINISDLAKKLGVAEGDVQIVVSVNVVPATDDVSKNNLKLASQVLEFSVTAITGSKSVEIEKFSTYVERYIKGTKDFNSNNSVAVKLNENGTFTSIPTIFSGKVATVKSLTNSKYTIVENQKTFSDVSSSSWAKAYIETLASKYIVNGKKADKFDPSANMTRAEFAVLLVRALGLPVEQYDGSFKDVKGIEWFARSGELTAAVKVGLVKGVTVDTFAPNANITRAQAAVMIQRAMELDFLNYDKSQLNKSKSLADFKDSSEIKTWAKSGVEAVYQAGLVDGKDGNKFDPNGNTQRQEIAKILANFLVSAKLMNKIN